MPSAGMVFCAFRAFLQNLSPFFIMPSASANLTPLAASDMVGDGGGATIGGREGHKNGGACGVGGDGQHGQQQQQ